MAEFIEKTMNHYLDKIISKESRKVEWKSEFSEPVAVAVISKILGLPVEDLYKIKSFSNAMAYFIGKEASNEKELEEKCKEVHGTFTEMMSYFRTLITHYRAHPSNCFISNTLHDPEAKQFTEKQGEELFIFHYIDLMFAGHGSISSLLSGGLAHLLLPQNRKYFDMLRTDPSIAPSVVEEMVRLVSPTQRISRVVLQDQDFKGYSLKKNQAICINLLKANNDPAVFPNPSRIEPGRSATHLGFGHSHHLCSGRNLARLQARVMIRLVAKRLPSLGLDEIAFGTNATFRIAEKVNLSF